MTDRHIFIIVMIPAEAFGFRAEPSRSASRSTSRSARPRVPDFSSRSLCSGGDVSPNHVFVYESRCVRLVRACCGHIRFRCTHGAVCVLCWRVHLGVAECPGVREVRADAVHPVDCVVSSPPKDQLVRLLRSRGVSCGLITDAARNCCCLFVCQQQGRLHWQPLLHPQYVCACKNVCPCVRCGDLH